MRDQTPPGQPFEQALRRALRPREPDAAFADRVLARLETQVAGERSVNEPAPLLRRRSPRRAAACAAPWRWLAPVLAACLIAGVGLTHWHQLQRARDSRAHAQLLQALVIASRSVNVARSVVLNEEQERIP